MLQHSLTLCFFLWFCGFAFSQDLDIRIIILDKANQPIERATVSISILKKHTTTDSHGVAKMTDIPYGNYILHVTFLGYQPLEKPIVVAKNTPDIQLVMVESTLTTDEIVVTGNFKAVRKSESVTPVKIYSTKFLETNSSASLFESIANINGIRTQIQCSVCYTGDIRINGMEGPYTMVMIDNMPIVSGLASVYGFLGIPNSIIQQVEVVRGPAAATYGSEAMGGVINIITRRPEDTPAFSFEVKNSSYKEFDTNITTSFTVSDNIRSLLSASVSYFDEIYDINDDNFTDLALTKRVSLFNKWSLERPNNRLANLAARYVYEDRWGGEIQWEPQFRGSDIIYGESIFTNRLEILGNYQLPTSETIVLNTSISFHDQDSSYGDTSYVAEQNIAFLQAFWEKSIGTRWNVVLGVSNRYTFYDDNTPITLSVDGSKNMPDNINLFGGFFHGKYKLSTDLEVLTGLRYDNNSIYGNIYSPRLGFKYKLGNNNFRLNAGRGFRVVNVFSEDHAALTGGRQVVFSEELEPENSWNVNLNFERFQLLGSSSFVKIDADIFYTFFSNKIVADYDTDPEKVIYANLTGYGDNYGVSLDTDWTVSSRIKFNIGTTFLQANLYDQNRRTNPLQTPNLTSNYSISYEFKRQNITLNFNGRIVSPMRLPVFPNDYRPEYSPTFNTSNFMVTKKIAITELYLGVRNLFNYLPDEDVILRAFDPFDKNITQNNPNNYSFDPSYNYAPMQTIRAFIGLRISI